MVFRDDVLLYDTFTNFRLEKERKKVRERSLQNVITFDKILGLLVKGKS